MKIGTEKDIERFKSKILPQVNGCWHYNGAKFPDGYGAFWYQGTTKGAHQFSAYHLAGFKHTPGLQICHRCDNPNCINPNHLFLGTTQENTKDRDLKGRTARGSRVGTSIYNESILKQIKDEFKITPYYRGIFRDLSKKHNVSYGVVWYLCKDKSWAHI